MSNDSPVAHVLLVSPSMESQTLGSRDKTFIIKVRQVVAGIVTNLYNENDMPYYQFKKERTCDILILRWF